MSLTPNLVGGADEGAELFHAKDEITAAGAVDKPPFESQRSSGIEKHIVMKL